MDRKNATILLDELFDKKFNQNKFEEFLSELFNGFELKDVNIHLRKEYNEYIESVNFLGLHFNQENRENIAFYVVKLKKKTSRDRSRVMQRNLIGRLLDQYKRDSALVAFYNDEQDDWRFSFVKVDYEIDTESFETKKKFSSAKRYSYLIGPQEPNHSCKSRFLGYLIDETQTITIEQMYDIFSVEKVTNEFFEKYNILFNNLKKSLDDVVNVDEDVQAEFEDKNIETSDFAKKLLGQIVFIYFLQKKGWLGVNYEKEYGTGSKKFFEEIYDNYKSNKGLNDNFFDGILEPLFYKALNIQRDRDYYEDLDCKIPFLNGGLFDTIKDYDWIKAHIKLDEKTFEEIIKTFKRFNFTVKEDEPLEKEVAVDPEMLGKVFENLLESGDRKAKGAFYTPREIVHYICQKTLINYLKNNSEVPEDTINEFIEKGYKLVDTIIRQQEEMEKGVRKKFVGNTLEILNEHSEILFKLLNDVKVVDPAVSSGAFPVGMMNELVNAKTILLLLKGKQEINNYELKRDIIENSLYGVDIEYFALDVAKLRFWLSLIVDEESVEEIRPLPNLDHKLMCGNSLIEEFEGVELFDKTLLKGVEAQTSLDRFHKESQSVLDDLRRLQKKFFNAENPNNKRKLKKEIDEKEWSLIEQTLKEMRNEKSINKLEEYKRANSKPFFLWELYFFEIFQGDNPGFDIIIGNPPYVGQKDNNDIKRIRSTNWGKKYSESMETVDLFYYFYHKSIDICKSEGLIALITTNYFITANGAFNLRTDFKKRTSILELLNFNELRLFESAKGQHNIISILQKIQDKHILANTFITHRKGDSNSNMLEKILWGKDNKTEYFNIPQEGLFEGKSNYIRVMGSGDSLTGNFKNDSILCILNKVKEKGVQITDKLDVKTGLRTGIDKVSNAHLKKINKGDFQIDNIYSLKEDVFIVSQEFYNNVPPYEKKLVKPLFKNSDIKRYYSVPSTDKYCLYVQKKDRIDEYPFIKNHLLKFKPLIESIRKNDSEIWYSIVRPREKRIFTSNKIIIPQRSKRNDFSYNENDFYASSDVYFIIDKKNPSNIDLKYALALINSKLYYCWFYYKGKRKGNNLELYQTPLSEIYIKDASIEEQQPFINLVSKILTLKGFMRIILIILN
ncbi:MAG: Eco57I restriction-modification methylase domain-containing protein [Methanobrevibacter sp.]|jgi:adenine-specific DNA-methyltransferase|nr:Eco57I restriction-modification methylase domain-containing protein [Candidatus Methanovirga procula]